MAKTVSRVRAARREANRPIPSRGTTTSDSYQNFAAQVGLGTNNQSSFGTYGFNPITRLRILLDWAYRGSWLVRACVDAIPEDMTREGIELTSGINADDKSALYTFLISKLQFWDRLCEAMTWGRLYGGAGLFVVIKGQKASEPLRMEMIPKGSFVRLVVLDRWMLNPSLNAVVTDPEDSDAGLPEYYDVVADAPIAARQRIHHSRFIRFDGLKLPYYQSLSENLWTLSILEPLYDRITAFDSTSLGIAQLVYKAHLRTYAVADLRKIIAAGGKMFEALYGQIALMRSFQSNEGLTLIDKEDEFNTHQYTFAGLSEVVVQFAQQVSGSEQIPLVRLFGQSPAGLNATGDSDWRNYYDGIKRRQESGLRHPIMKLLRVAAASENIKLADDFNFEFVPLWQLDHQQRAAVAAQVTSTVGDAMDRGLITNRGQALKELKASSTYTGIWASITDDDIEEAEQEPPPPIPGEEGEQVGFLPGQQQQPPEPEEPQESFLPGLEPDPPSGAEDDNFLPRTKKRSFLPGGTDTDSAGAFFGGETERRDFKIRKPLVHLHVADQNLPGRATTFAGFPVVIEVEKGKPRFEGSSGGAVMEAPYGYFPNTVGHDGDAVDVFLGDNVASPKVYIINQCTPDTREFHQHKCFLGFDKPTDVSDVFTKFYADGQGGKRLQRGFEMTVPEFRVWLEKFDARKARKAG